MFLLGKELVKKVLLMYRYTPLGLFIRLGTDIDFLWVLLILEQKPRSEIVISDGKFTELSIYIQIVYLINTEKMIQSRDQI